MTEEEIKELSNELKEIEEVKMPLVMQKLEQGSLKENSLYEKAENEQKALDTRAREIKFINSSVHVRDSMFSNHRYFLCFSSPDCV